MAFSFSTIAQGCWNLSNLYTHYYVTLRRFAMGFNDSNAMFTMPVAPTAYGNGGFGGFGGDGAEMKD